MKPILAAVTAGLVWLSAPDAQANLVRYQANLGPEAQGATGSGFVTVDWDAAANTLLIDADWTGLTGTTTVAHIHCCTTPPGVGTVGVAVTPGTLPGFPVGAQSGGYSSPPLDLFLAATFTAVFVNNFAGGVFANADDALIAGINAGRAYFNIHTTSFPGGEIRGFLQVPEPSSLGLLALALTGLAASRRRRA